MYWYIRYYTQQVFRLSMYQGGRKQLLVGQIGTRSWICLVDKSMTLISSIPPINSLLGLGIRPLKGSLSGYCYFQEPSTSYIVSRTTEIKGNCNVWRDWCGVYMTVSSTSTCKPWVLKTHLAFIVFQKLTGGGGRALPVRPPAMYCILWAVGCSMPWDFQTTYGCKSLWRFSQE